MLDVPIALPKFLNDPEAVLGHDHHGGDLKFVMFILCFNNARVNYIMNHELHFARDFTGVQRALRHCMAYQRCK